MAGKFIIKKSTTGYVFHLLAGNHEIILTGGEVYETLDGAKKGAQSVKNNAPSAEVEDQTQNGYETKKHPKFELYKDAAGKFRFRLKASNGQIIGSSEGYETKAGAENGIDSVKRNAPTAEITQG